MKTYHISEAEYEAAKALAKKNQNKRVDKRLQVIILRYEGLKDQETNVFSTTPFPAATKPTSRRIYRLSHRPHSPAPPPLPSPHLSAILSPPIYERWHINNGKTISSTDPEWSQTKGSGGLRGSGARHHTDIPQSAHVCGRLIK